MQFPDYVLHAVCKNEYIPEKQDGYLSKDFTLVDSWGEGGELNGNPCNKTIFSYGNKFYSVMYCYSCGDICIMNCIEVKCVIVEQKKWIPV